MKVLIFGGTGLLGNTLVHAWKDRAQILYTTRGSERAHEKGVQGITFDCHWHSVESLLREYKPDVAINCIGAVSHRNPTTEETIFLNALWPHRLAEACTQQDVRLIHISTDCVFSGHMRAPQPHKEYDTPDADRLYGRSKLLGEVKEHLTIRTSFVGRELPSRVAKQDAHCVWEWFRSQRDKESIPGHAAVIYSGLVVLEFAYALWKVVSDFPWLRGLYHVAGEPIPKIEYLKAIREAEGYSVALKPTYTPSKNYGLDGSAFNNHTGYNPSCMPFQVEQYVRWLETIDDYKGTVRCK